MNSKDITCDVIDGPPITVSVDDLVFRPSVYGLLIEDEKILLSKQWDGYDFPGGGIDLAETVDEGLEREFFEETGVQVKRQEIIAGESSFFFHPIKKKAFNCVMLYYVVRRVGGEISVANLSEDEQEYAGMPEWIPIAEVANLKFINAVDSSSLITQGLRVLSARK